MINNNTATVRVARRVTTADVLFIIEAIKSERPGAKISDAVWEIVKDEDGEIIRVELSESA